MAAVTPADLIHLAAPGSMAEVRDEERIVRATQQKPAGGVLVKCIGPSTLVRDTEATFCMSLDRIAPLWPEGAELVQDDSPNSRTASRFLEIMGTGVAS